MRCLTVSIELNWRIPGPCVRARTCMERRGALPERDGASENVCTVGGLASLHLSSQSSLCDRKSCRLPPPPPPLFRHGQMRARMTTPIPTRVLVIHGIIMTITIITTVMITSAGPALTNALCGNRPSRLSASLIGTVVDKCLLLISVRLDDTVGNDVGKCARFGRRTGYEVLSGECCDTGSMIVGCWAWIFLDVVSIVLIQREK